MEDNFSDSANGGYPRNDTPSESGHDSDGSPAPPELSPYERERRDKIAHNEAAALRLIPMSCRLKRPSKRKKQGRPTMDKVCQKPTRRSGRIAAVAAQSATLVPSGSGSDGDASDSGSDDDGSDSGSGSDDTTSGSGDALGLSDLPEYTKLVQVASAHAKGEELHVGDVVEGDVVVLVERNATDGVCVWGTVSHKIQHARDGWQIKLRMSAVCKQMGTEIRSRVQDFGWSNNPKTWWVLGHFRMYALRAPLVQFTAVAATRKRKEQR